MKDGVLAMKIESVRKMLEAFRHKRVAVVGDLMLDRYIWGKASKISPEAPIPVVTVRDVTAVPGGAANVLRNLSALGADALAFGVAGGDPNGDSLCALLSATNVETSGVLRDPARKTTEKARIIAGNQQVVRVDTEHTEPLSESQADELIELLRAACRARPFDAIIIEDYAKGVVSEWLAEAVLSIGKEMGVPVALDPHPAHPLDLKGISVFTPNRAEAFALAGCYFVEGEASLENDKPLLDVVERLQALWAPECLLVTLGARGMALFRHGQSPLHVPTRAREVFDVSGAGDTVIASFVLALAAGAAPEDAATLANHAAGVVVGKVGTAPVCPDELLVSFHEDVP